MPGMHADPAPRRPGMAPDRRAGRAVQLAFILPGLRAAKAAPLLLPAQRKHPAPAAEHDLGDAAVTPARWQWLQSRPAVQQVSAHLVDPAQGALFDVRRDWSCVTVGGLGQLPALTPAASGLLEALTQHARDRGWTNASRNAAERTLRILLAWVGADAPIHEADIRALARRRATTIRRVLQFLTQNNMVIPDPARRARRPSAPSNSASRPCPTPSRRRYAAGCRSCAVRDAGRTRSSRSPPSAPTSTACCRSWEAGQAVSPA